MSGNTFGELFRLTTFGESHGHSLGGIIDGCPAGIHIDTDFIQKAVDRRKSGSLKTGNSKVNFNPATPRNEEDKVIIQSGVFDGLSTGTPISFYIENSTARSSDYSNIKDSFRPGHADFTFYEKYGIRDYRGGGRSSGRETVARVAGGAIAQLFIKSIYKDYSVTAFTKEAAGITCNSNKVIDLLKDNLDSSIIDENAMRTLDIESAEKMLEKIAAIKEEGDSVGGIIQCFIKGIEPGLGEPVFNKLDAVLAKAMLSIGAIKGFEIGDGFNCARLKGSECNDSMSFDETTKSITFLSNHSGGTLGGISNGNIIDFSVAVKPVPSIAIRQNTITTNNENIQIDIKGRHDTCLCPRIVPVIEAMSSLTIADMILLQRCSK